MQREAIKYLVDIAQACERLRKFTAGKTFKDYTSDAMLRSAVERQFEIVGEALSKALDVDPELAGRISDTRRIVAFRNRLIHGYASVSDDLVWGVLETNLPVLSREVDRLVSEAG